MKGASNSAGRVAVVIVHYRTPDLLANCLASLRTELSDLDEVVIVDNASGASSIEKLRALGGGAGEKHRITLLESPVNAGFAAGNNLGIEHVLAHGGCEFILLLNPDTLVIPGAIFALRTFLESHPDVSIVGPRLEYPDGSPQLSAFGDQTPLSELLRGANVGLLSRLLKPWEVYGTIRHEAHRADWLSGACLMLRRDTIERVGLLDERFFMYFEETDYCRRARLMGLDAWYMPSARVVHLVGQSSGMGDWAARRLPACWFESRHRYFRKHFGYLGMVMADIGWFCGHIVMRLRKALTGVSHSAIAVRETGDFLLHAFRALFGQNARRARESQSAGGGHG